MVVLYSCTKKYYSCTIRDDESMLKHLQESSFSSVEHETFNEIFALLIQGVIDG